MTRRASTCAGVHKSTTTAEVWFCLQSALAELAKTAVADKYRSAAIWHADAPQHIIRMSAGRVGLWWEPYDPSNIPLNFHCFPVNLGQTRFGVLAVASELIQPDTLLHVELTTQMCAYLTSLVELQTIIYCLMSQARCRYPQHQGDDNGGEEGLTLPHPILTSREQDILISLCRGESEHECARRLYLAPATVHSHRQRLFRRLDVHAPHEAILLSYALRLVNWAGIVEPEDPIAST